LVLADSSADPRLVAADLLGQAEHGPTSPATQVRTGLKPGFKPWETGHPGALRRDVKSNLSINTAKIEIRDLQSFFTIK
jgi:hypothetical protein